MQNILTKFAKLFVICLRIVSLNCSLNYDDIALRRCTKHFVLLSGGKSMCSFSVYFLQYNALSHHSLLLFSKSSFATASLYSRLTSSYVSIILLSLIFQAMNKYEFTDDFSLSM